ncbi:MAG TPA: NAD(P)-dependent oxidoreductase [Spirochaetia bacterium]|nr:NAD(P)-dependent oxidoreductase [Spirochaetia bacterium]
MSKKKIVVTGGSGKAGRAIVRDLLEHGYDVLNVDLAPPADRLCPFLKADVCKLGEAFESLAGSNAVVHMAAIPAPGLLTEETTFRINAESTFNIFAAATALRMERVVWASSETTLGLPFEREKPAYVPIDENHPLYPESSYALSKVLGEEMARQYSRWTGIPFIGLRFSNIMEPEDYKAFPSYWNDARLRKWNLWGYIDARDVAQSCRLALEKPLQGAQAFIIAAADTVMNRPSKALMAEVFPSVPLRGEIGEFETLLSIRKARSTLGFAPRWSWREHVGA